MSDLSDTVNDGTTWEERMAARSYARRINTPDPEHGGHHQHLIGCGMFCSCGAFYGPISVVMVGDWDPLDQWCDTCGMTYRDWQEQIGEHPTYMLPDAEKTD